MDPVSLLSHANEVRSILSICWSAAVVIKEAFDNARENPDTVALLLTTYKSFLEVVELQCTDTEQRTLIWRQSLDKIKGHCQTAESKLQTLKVQVATPQWRQLGRATAITNKLESILQEAMATEGRLFLLDGFRDLGVQLSHVDLALRELIRFQTRTHQSTENQLVGIASILSLVLDRLSEQGATMRELSDVVKITCNIVDIGSVQITGAGPSTFTNAVSEDTGSSSPLPFSQREVEVEDSFRKVDQKAQELITKLASCMLSDNDKHDAQRFVNSLIIPRLIGRTEIDICKMKRDGFILPHEIGRGATSIVYKAKLFLDGHESADQEVPVAVKCLRESSNLTDVRASFLTESNILSEVRHASIVHYYGSYWPEEGEAEWPPPLVVMELMQGHLGEYRGQLKGDQATQVLCNLAEALEYLHGCGFLHLDIKPSNILVKFDRNGRLDGRAKLSDFGVSRKKQVATVGGQTIGATVHGGTPEFMAPELLEEGGRATTKVDVWSFGAVMCWLLDNSGAAGSSSALEEEKMGAGGHAMRWRGISREKWLSVLPSDRSGDSLRALASSCLSLDPKARPGMGAVRQELEYELAGLDDEWRANLRGKRADVLFETGLKMYFGIDCTRESRQAGRWFSHAENFGSADAAYVLCMAYQARSNDSTEVEPRNEMDVVFETMQASKNPSHEVGGRAKWFLSNFYRAGMELNKNDSRAVELLEAAAEGGNACAQVDLGMMFLRGEGVSKNSRRAVLLFERAIVSGKVRAMEGLAYCHTHGEGVVKNSARGADLYRQAAEAGSAEAKEQLLKESMRKDDSEGSASESAVVGGSRKDATVSKQAEADYVRGLTLCNALWKPSRCVPFFEKAAEAGHAQALFRLGNLYHDGKHVLKNMARAMEFYRRAAEAGSSSAQVKLDAYVKEEVEKSYQQGLKFYEAKKYSQAVVLFERAAQSGHTLGQFYLGSCYHFGHGVAQSYTRAVDLFQKAAGAGNADAQVFLGVCYKYGLGVQQDYARAVELYQKAAEAGNAMAQNKLGFCYQNGHGVQQDYARAVEHYQKAADAGNAKAQVNLGICYDYGYCNVTKNASMATEYYTKAAKNGLSDAQKRLDELRAKE